MRGSPAPRLSVIVPATDGSPTLDRCLDSLRSGADELVVVTEPAGAGPAEARNLGAARATGDVLVFVDSDVVVHPDALERMRAAFAGDETLTAVFGCYDDAPEADGVVSRFRNLLHHHVHRAAAGQADTFWAGLGAVRSRAFAAAGGFDAGRFPRSSIEDIELGMRLSRGGAHIELHEDIQGKHLKRWTLARMVRTDLVDRGIPWVAMLLREREAPRTLNLGWRHRASAGASVLLAASAARRQLGPGAAALGALVALNRDFYSLLARRMGVPGAAAGVALHVLHHLVSAAAVPCGVAAYAVEASSRDRAQRDSEAASASSAGWVRPSTGVSGARM